MRNIDEREFKREKNNWPGSEAGYCKRILPAYTSSEAGSNERGDIGGKRSTALKQRMQNFEIYTYYSLPHNNTKLIYEWMIPTKTELWCI